MKIDPGVQRLVDALNGIKEVATTSSCAGHKCDNVTSENDIHLSYGNFYVDIDIDYNKSGWQALECIVSTVKRCVESETELLVHFTPWLDGGLRWDLRGTYVNQDDIDILAEMVERASCVSSWLLE